MHLVWKYSVQLRIHWNEVNFEVRGVQARHNSEFDLEVLDWRHFESPLPVSERSTTAKYPEKTSLIISPTRTTSVLE